MGSGSVVTVVGKEADVVEGGGIVDVKVGDGRRGRERRQKRQKRRERREEGGKEKGAKESGRKK